tara:strand:+ start:29 stop:511 length:483 start_codon:yes stop_codon:yes gene_type:complete
MSNFQVLKLSNGDDVICNLVETKDNTFKITSPLKMDTVNRITKKGVSESLALTRWIQPFSEQEHFYVEKTSVVVMAEASVGLTRYYQYVLRTLDKLVTTEKFNPTEISEEEFLDALELKRALEKEKKKPIIDEEVPEDDEILEEEENLLLDLMNSKKTIH